MNRRALAGNVALFTLFALGFAIWRHGFAIVWDDTNLYKLAVRAALTEGREDWVRVLRAWLAPAFAHVTND